LWAFSPAAPLRYRCLTTSLTRAAAGAIVPGMADEAPNPERPRESFEQRERRYELIADGLRDGLDPDRIAAALGISRRQLTPMLGAARRWQARQDALAGWSRETVHGEMLDELCKAVCEHGRPASAAQLAGLVGRSRTEPGWSLQTTADMLREAVMDGLVRRQGAGAFGLTAQGVVRSQCYRRAYERPVGLEIDGRELTWEGYGSARAIARRVALQRWRVTRIPLEAPDRDAWEC
jgi:hypothetical protein